MEAAQWEWVRLQDAEWDIATDIRLPDAEGFWGSAEVSEVAREEASEAASEGGSVVRIRAQGYPAGWIMIIWNRATPDFLKNRA